MDIDSIVEEVRRKEERKREEAERLREELENEPLTGGHEERFVHDVSSGIPGEFSVAGVDGGLVRKELHGMDLVMRRAVAAVFDYESGELDGASYLPEKSPSPETETVSGSVSREEINRLASLLRLRAEIEVAADALEEADMVLLDGSLLPRMRDRPAEDSPFSARYEELLEMYRELYTGAGDSGVHVAGVVEDSRGSRMCNILAENGMGDGLLAESRDSTLLIHVLEEGERTFIAPYSESNSPVIQDVGLGDSFHVFYLRPVEKDRPVRIEVYSPGDPVGKVEEVASAVMSLCHRGSSYSIPPVLIEADQRASLSGSEAEMLSRRLKAKLSHLPGTEELRRDRRPF